MADNLPPAAVERAVEVIGRTPGAQWYSAQQAARALAAAGLLVTPEHDARASDLPTTEDVRFTYAAEREEQTGIRSNEWGRRFDAWLAEHDAQVAARAWDEGFTRGFYAAQVMPRDADASESTIPNPYEQEGDR